MACLNFVKGRAIVFFSPCLYFLASFLTNLYHSRMYFTVIYALNFKEQVFPILVNAAQSMDLSKQAVHGNGFKTQLGEWNIQNFKDLPLNHQAEYIKIEKEGLRVMKSLALNI
jgi:hypothetical protein